MEHTIITLPSSKFKPKKTKYPVHRKVANEFIYNEEVSNWIMVHGYLSTKTGSKSYAWLEYAGRVYDVNNEIELPKKAFYKKYSPFAVVLYSLDEMKANLRRFKRYGNWEIV